MSEPAIDVSKLRTASIDRTDPSTGAPNKYEPNDSTKDYGELSSAEPPVNWWNYRWNLIWQWLTHIVNDVMKGTYTFLGVKTFDSIPVLPASDPTTANQATRKSYVDTLNAQNVKLTGNQSISDTKQFENLTITNVGNFNRGATIIVASTDSNETDKNGADLVLDPDNDEMGASVNDIMPTSGVLRICEGTYNLSFPIEGPDNVIITGDGYGTHIKFANNLTSHAFHIGASIKNCRIKNLRIDGNNVEQNNNFTAYYGIFCEAGDDSGCWIENVFVENIKTATTGVYNGVITGLSGGNIKECYVKNLEHGKAAGASYGIISSARVIDCVSEDCIGANIGYGYYNSKRMRGNQGSGNKTSTYNTCYADSGTSYPVADTPNGGFNS